MIYQLSLGIFLTLLISSAILFNTSYFGTAEGQTAQSPSGIQSQVETALLEFYPTVIVEFNGNKTLVLEGDEEFMLKSEGTLATFWTGIDKAKEFGYELDEVTTSGMGSEGNPTRFYAIMSLEQQNK